MFNAFTEHEKATSRSAIRAGNAPCGEALCDEARIRAALAETRGKLGREHGVRKARTRLWR